MTEHVSVDVTAALLAEPLAQMSVAHSAGHWAVHLVARWACCSARKKVFRWAEMLADSKAPLSDGAQAAATVDLSAAWWAQKAAGNSALRLALRTAALSVVLAVARWGRTSGYWSAVQKVQR